MQFSDIPRDVLVNVICPYVSLVDLYPLHELFLVEASKRPKEALLVALQNQDVVLMRDMVDLHPEDPNYLIGVAIRYGSTMLVREVIQRYGPKTILNWEQRQSGKLDITDVLIQDPTLYLDIMAVEPDLMIYGRVTKIYFEVGYVRTLRFLHDIGKPDLMQLVQNTWFPDVDRITS